MRWFGRVRLDTSSKAVIVSVAASVGLLGAGLTLEWADKHALVPSFLGSAALTGAAALVTGGKKLLQDSFAKRRQAREEAERILARAGQSQDHRTVAEMDPARLRIHPAAYLPGDAERTPVPYVERDIHARLVAIIPTGAFVLLQGDSASGKSRTAFEAARQAVGDWRLIVPEAPDAAPDQLDGLAGLELADTLIWLDDLQRYLSPSGLTERLGPAGVATPPCLDRGDYQ
ncbi:MULTISPECIES: hypothetical protein [unclassified Streptomyces]|uniref:hypothetical protein n=1 Tax=unclassified Streptomyces TaxID=2593676 RepID=UPI003820CF4C